MACCLLAPSHYLNQCWVLMEVKFWHSLGSNLTASAKATILWNEFEFYTFEIIATSPGGHWVKYSGTSLQRPWNYQQTPTKCLILSIQIDGLMQEKRNSIANALELHLSCTNQLKQRLAWETTSHLRPHWEVVFLERFCPFIPHERPPHI